ncbi:response regulator [archaeon]|nr:response regulator [archaeon]
MAKIMVVDDNERILEVLSKVLERKGYEVMVANSGEKCLEMLKSEKPDLILMDVMMPEMNGWKVVEKIKADPSNKGIIISMLTVKSMTSDKDKSLIDVGADYHISKPIDNDELLSTISHLLKTHE